MLLTRQTSWGGRYQAGDPEYYHLPTCQAGYWIGNYHPLYGADCSERCREAHDLVKAIAKTLRIKTIHLRGLRKIKLI